MSIGQVAERAGVSVASLHFYESKGLISSQRSSGNQRRYAREVLRRIAFIRAAQRVGYSLAQIRQAFAALPAERTPNAEDWAKLAADWRDDIDERMRQLQRLRDELDGCIGCGCLSLSHCRLANPDDQLGSQGQGPQRWVG